MSALYSLPGDEWAHLLTPTVFAGGADPNFGLANLSDRNPALPFKATGTSLTFSYDRGSAQLSGLIALIHGNLTGTAVWKRWTTADLVTGTGETFPFTLASIDADGYYDAAWVDCSSGPARRYEGLVITGNVATIQIGQLWASAVTRAFANFFVLTPVSTLGEYLARVPPLRTAAQVKLAFSNYGRIRLMTGVIKDSPTNLNTFRDAMRSTGGQDQSFLLVPDSTVPTSSWLLEWATGLSQTAPMTDHQDFSETRDYPLVQQLPIGFREIAKGRAIGAV